MKYVIAKLSSLLLILIMIMPSATHATQAKNDDDDLQTLYISAERIPCAGVDGQVCLQIRFDPDDEWEMLYDNIINFAPQSNVEYTLLVRVVDGDSDLADAPEIQYQLVEILNRRMPDPNSMNMMSFYQLTGEFFTVTVASRTAGCTSWVPTTCLQVYFEPNRRRELFDAGIFDFGFEAGYEYTLRIQRALINSDNLADMPGIMYRLEEIISKTIVNEETATSVPLVLTRWTLNGYENAGGFEPLLDGTAISLNFDGYNLWGYTNCNTYAGVYQRNANDLTFEALLTTSVSCLGEVILQQDIRFFEALEMVSMYSVEDDILRIQLSNDEFMVFSPMVEEVRILADTNWIVEAFESPNPDTPDIPVPVQTPLITQDDAPNTIHFDDTWMLAEVGCNTIWGNYQQIGNQITFTRLGMSVTACDDEAIMQQEAYLFQTLRDVNTVRVDGTTIRLQFGANDYIVLSPAEE